ncbi:MAG: hypothetical protein KDI08_03910, partial [Pseudomonadales bacterium]|nr:hypothetical protein [Pseudomonadales bacterium]
MSVAVASVLSLPVAAVTLAGGSVLLFMILLRATRLARAPWYARGFIMELMCPTLVGLGAFGFFLM